MRVTLPADLEPGHLIVARFGETLRPDGHVNRANLQTAASGSPLKKKKKEERKEGRQQEIKKAKTTMKELK